MLPELLRNGRAKGTFFMMRQPHTGGAELRAQYHHTAYLHEQLSITQQRYYLRRTRNYDALAAQLQVCGVNLFKRVSRAQMFGS